MPRRKVIPFLDCFTIYVNPALRPHVIPLDSFLEQNPAIDRLFCSAFIFAPPGIVRGFSPTIPRRLLLLRRASTHSNFPGLWEIPGALASEEDLTILQSLASMLSEQTNLQMCKVIRKVGADIKWTTEEKDDGDLKEYRWMERSFEIEVVEIPDLTSEKVFDPESIAQFLGSLPIVLDYQLHQEYAWATEEDIRKFLNTGEGRQIISKEEATKMLHAFALRRATSGLARME
ncbi:MAG: hypothetical protein Q9220_005953 [cf. Caloplaca sp. 1 TL-2023]